MAGVRGLRDGEEGGPADQEGEGHLAGGGSVGFGDPGEDPATPAAGGREFARAEGAVGHDRDAVLFTERDYGMLDGPLLQVIENLVAGDLPLAGNLESFGKLLLIEVAQPPGADLAGGPQLFKRGDRIRQGMRAVPVQEIAVQMVGAEMPQAPFAGFQGAAPGGVLRQDLADQEDLVAPAREGLPHQIFHLAVAVELGGVDMAHPQVEPAPERLDGRPPVVLLHVPGPLADDGDLGTGGSESPLSHPRSSRFSPEMQEPVHLVGSPAMTGRRLLLAVAVLLCVRIASAAPSGFAALGDEIVRIVRDEFLDPGRAALWAEENAGYGAAVRDAEAFRRETRQRLAALATSHTAYYTPDDAGYYELLAIFEAVLKKNPETESLGLAAVEQDEGWFVTRVFAGGPAEAAGIRRGDRLATADGAPFHPKLSLRGKAGRPVRLGVQSRRGGPVREIAVTPRLVNPRQEWIEAQRSGSRVLENRGRRIAYAPLWSCAGEDFQGLLAESLAGDLKEAAALVLDLRGGWGGCNPSFVSLFDPAVPDLTRIERSGQSVVWASSWRKPVVVLIDGGSRSGKEVVARALQRHKRATLVGERTAGAVVAGRPFLLSDGSLLFLAVHDVRVDGERLEGVGVTPDVPVSPDLPYAEGRDPQLERALDLAAGSPRP